MKRIAYEVYFLYRFNYKLKAFLDLINKKNIDINEIRPSVLKAAWLMEQVLRKHDHKGGWKSCTNHYLMNRFFEEVEEARTEYQDLPYSKLIPYNKGLSHRDFVVSNALALEIIDSMNMGMMLLDNIEKDVILQFLY